MTRLKWMEGSTRMEGTFLDSYRHRERSADGVGEPETWLVIFGTDGYIHEIRASEIVPI